MHRYLLKRPRNNGLTKKRKNHKKNMDCKVNKFFTNNFYSNQFILDQIKKLNDKIVYIFIDKYIFNDVIGIPSQFASL